MTSKHAFKNMILKYTPPPRIKGRAKNWTGDQFWRWTGRARMDGREFFVFLKGKHWENRGKFPEKTGRATKKVVVDGRHRNLARPFIRRGVYDFMFSKILRNIFETRG